MWRRRRGAGALIACVVIAGAASLAMALPNLYRTSATVLVMSPQVSEAFVKPSVMGELEVRLQKIDQQVMSRANLADLITRLDLYPVLRKFASMDAAVDRMRLDIKLGQRSAPQPNGTSQTVSFTITYTGQDPQVVTTVANELAALYVNENSASRKGEAVQTAQFLKEQLAASRSDVERAQQRMNRFQSANSSELPQQVEANLSALDRLNDQLRFNTDAQMRAMDKREMLLKELAQNPSGKVLPPPTDPLVVRYNTLVAELADLRGRGFTDEYPAVIRAKAQITSLEEDMARKGIDKNGPSPASATGPGRASGNGAPVSGAPAPGTTQASISQIDAELKNLKDAATSLRKMIDGYQARVERAPRVGQEAQQFTRDYDIENSRYQALLKQYNEAQLAESVEGSKNAEQFRLLDPAVVPGRPIAPNRLMLLGMGLAAAIGLGVAVMLATERLDTSFHSAEDLQAFTRLPTLATVGRIWTRASRRRRRARRFAAVLATTACLVVLAAGVYHFASNNEDLVRLLSR